MHSIRPGTWLLMITFSVIVWYLIADSIWAVGL